MIHYNQMVLDIVTTTIEGKVDIKEDDIMGHIPM
jgi:hypothetical protein